MKLSIIIVNWNTRDLLAGCLRSLRDDLTALRQDGVETFVVDNASGDGSAAMIQQQFPWVHLIENQENVGFAAANNQAIARSSGQYVLLLNPDTRVLSGAICSLVAFLDANPGAGAAGARLINRDGSLQTSCYPAPTLGRELWRLLHLDRFYPYGSYRKDRWFGLAPQEVEVLKGACLIIRKDVLDQVGLLDDDYYVYTEEVDLCYRIRKAGQRIDRVPDAQVIHYGGQSTGQMASEMFLQLYGSKILYFRKNHGYLSAQVYKLILLLATVLRLSIMVLILFGFMTQRERGWELASNYYRLLQILPKL